MAITGSVGRNGSNRPRDAVAVQFLLNEIFLKSGGTLLKVDGIAGPKTIGAIEQFQRRNGLATDGRADPNGRTITLLGDRLKIIILAGLKNVPNF